MYILERRPARGRRSGAPSSRPRRRARPPRRPALTFEVHDDSPCGRGRRAGAGVRLRRRWPTSVATSRKISTDQDPDPAFYETSVADALAAHKPFVLVFATPKFCATRPVRTDARPAQAGGRGESRRDVHQRRAVPARGRRRPAPARARRERRPPGATDVTNEWGLYFEPWIFAVDRDGIVRGSYEVVDLGRRARRRPRGDHRRAADQPLAGGVLEPDRDERRRPRLGTRPGPARPSPGARRGGPAGTSRRSRARRARTSASRRPSVRRSKPLTSVRPAESTADDDALDRLIGLGRRTGRPRLPEQDRGDAVDADDDATRIADEDVARARVHPSGGARSARRSTVAVPVLPGA